MIYALNTQDLSDRERRLIARLIQDGQTDSLAQDQRIVHVCDPNGASPRRPKTDDV